MPRAAYSAVRAVVAARRPQPIDRNAELHGAGNDGHGGQLSDLAAAGPPMSSKPDPRERGAKGNKGKEMAIRIALAR
ncbi:hypothetical protein EAS62_11475 [Bradyrhizobium zhanjiangense]|uniref:Transposase n=1 Tax=Bradyrhizobium zhanjiangense TaxID=1325107 RepID=A0ABY0DMP5_9BRAD|nr:hypothetical protein EAS62_11475 [Bradyrhizobium zhanjiangense]